MQRTRSVTIVFPSEKCMPAGQGRIGTNNVEFYHSRHRRQLSPSHCNARRKDDCPYLIHSSPSLEASADANWEGTQPRDFCQFLPPALQPKEYLPLLYRLQSSGRISASTDDNNNNSAAECCVVGGDYDGGNSCEASPKVLLPPGAKSPEQIIDECGGKAQFIELMRNLYHR